MVSDTRILYLAFGRAGRECLKLLLDEGYSKDRILVYTYDLEDNMCFLEFLKIKNIEYSTTPLKKCFNEIKNFLPDIIVSMHYRDLIPRKILELADNRGMNLHPSLLPSYSGCLATMWVIINGEIKSGITYHYLTPKFDDGNILIQEEMEVLENETGESLFNKAVDLGVNLFLPALKKLLDGEKGFYQKGERSYYTRDLPYNGIINKSWDRSRVDRFIRAFTFNNKPYAKVLIENKLVEISSIETYDSLRGKL